MTIERRRRTRVRFTIKARLVAPGVKRQECETKNLSVNGVLIVGAVEIKVGSLWGIELSGKLKHSSFRVRIKAKAIRTTPNGAAFAFEKMDDDCYALLQTVVIYNADDPIAVVGEFTPQFEPG